MMKNSKILPAATIMLARTHNGRLEVLLLQRNKTLVFAPGQWVFPGGRIEAEEIALGANDMDAAKIAAIRETKEEAGLDVEKEALIFIRHWTTPAINERRFATWFFFAGIGAGAPEVQIDDGEIKAYQWIEPQTALEQFKQGELAMLPPTFLNLQLIRTCKTVHEAVERLKEIEPLYVLPVVQLTKGAYNIMYKGDAGYETINFDAMGPRHRLTIDLQRQIVQFEYQNCSDYLPVNGGDDFFD